MKTPRLMLLTLAALVPGIAAYTWVFGWGVLINLLVAATTAVTTEAVILKIRRQRLTQLADGSALLTGTLLALCLPPLLPLWMVITGTLFALVFGKHVYGGLGQNVFNPAMVGFAVLVLSFPLAMSQWPAVDADTTLTATLAAKSNTVELRADWDGISGATPLDAYRFRAGQTNAEFFIEDTQQNWRHWLWINLAFLAGGLLLLYSGVIRWQAPVAFLVVLGICAMAFYDAGSSASLGSPLFHLFSGAAMLGAFFILTDPVTSPSSARGLLLFGALIGLITFIIRTQGAYPEGIAFAVLLMNATAPLLDQLPGLRTSRA